MSRNAYKLGPPLTSDLVGRLLFGSYARLQFGIWVAELPGGPRRFSQVEYREWCKQMHVPFPPVGAMLARFETLKMVRFEKPDKHSRVKYYTRLDSPLWGMFLIARSAINDACDEPVAWPGPSPSPAKMRAAAERLLELRTAVRDA